MKLKYRIRRIFFPRHHDKIIYEINALRKERRMLMEEKKKYLKMMERGFLGDALWRNFREVCNDIKYIDGEIENRKERYGNRE